MHRILSVIAGVLVVATTPSLSAQQQIATAAVERLAGATAAIRGTAVDAGNGALAKTLVRVRDARLGRIVSQSVTDKAGAYSFKGLDPGNYVVEIVSNNQTTIAATNLISANAGETVTAVVKLPFNPTLLGELLKQESVWVSTGSSNAAALAATSTGLGLEQIPAVIPAPIPVSER